MIKLQEGAVKHLKELTEKHSKPYVRLSIKGGGCAGFGYDWSFEEQPSAKDFVIDNLLLIDKIFELYLLGMELDYKYFKQVSRCYNCDFIRIPTACSDVIP